MPKFSLGDKPPAHSTRSWDYTPCPTCKGPMAKRSKLCWDCTAAAKRSPDDSVICVVDGDPCRRLPLTQQQYALVDADNYCRLYPLKCYAVWAPSTRSYYAYRYNFALHRATPLQADIITIRSGLWGDHINGNTLDYRRSNLRECTRAQNVFNSKLMSRNTSGFRGVSWDAQKQKFRARISFQGTRVTAGWFIDPVEAAKAWDHLAVTLIGKFARLNFPTHLTPPFTL